jgi:hypothetical protein
MSAERRQVSFNSNDDLIAEINRLRKGYTQTGNWSLAQICWHLNGAMTYFASPGPHPDPGPEDPEKREWLNQVLTLGRLPRPVQAPERMIPPTTSGDLEIEQFLATLERLKTFTGPYAPHRLFGKLTADEGRRLSMIHAAHHFSFLLPTSEMAAITAEG